MGCFAEIAQVEELNPFPLGRGCSSLCVAAAGQAVATAHVPTHALGSAIYAVKSVADANIIDVKAVVAVDKGWQLQRLPENLQKWVITGLKKNQWLLPRDLRY